MTFYNQNYTTYKSFYNIYYGVGEVVELILKHDHETEVFIKTLKNSHVYLDIRAKYDEIYVEGVAYSEEQDVFVHRYASEKYNITIEEIVKIYVDTEWAIGEFKQKRLEYQK